MHLLKQLEGD